MENIGISPVDSSDLKKAQEKMVLILNEIDRICKQHNIKWWIYYGTLLGAVRHKGFIPWDDDCDICMLRADYEKFLKHAKTDLGEIFFLQNKDTDPCYTKKLTKIRLNDTIFVEKEEKIDEQYHQGIYVDVFVLDYLPEYSKGLLGFFLKMYKLRESRKLYCPGTVKRAWISLYTAIINLFCSPAEKIISKIWQINGKNDKLKYIGVLGPFGNRRVLEYQDIFPLKTDLIFEGRHFPVPYDYKKCLTMEYGDYMQLPPVEDRAFHAKLIKC